MCCRSEHSLFILKRLLFVFGCAGSSLLCLGFLGLWQAGVTLCYDVWSSYCGDFSCCGARALGEPASVAAVSGLSSCGRQAYELQPQPTQGFLTPCTPADWKRHTGSTAGHVHYTPIQPERSPLIPAAKALGLVVCSALPYSAEPLHLLSG